VLRGRVARNRPKNCRSKCRLATQLSGPRSAMAMAAKGQEEPFQMQTLSDREAPIPAIRVIPTGRTG
jgi:hypothetical protein